VIEVLVVISVFGVLELLFVRYFLSGADHRHYDLPDHPVLGFRSEPSIQHQRAAEELKASSAPLFRSGGRGARLAEIRSRMDRMGDDLLFDGSIIAVNAGGVPSEWVVASGAKPSRRLLYIHGGAFIAGSPKSHRPITTQLSQRTKSAVLAIDYRLMPENPRKAGIEDSRIAYRWILENGPDGPSSQDILILAGDSAGGNLVLSTAAWARDNKLKMADGVIALSPTTDSSWASPSIKYNRDTDVMLGKSLGRITRVPYHLRLWFSWFFTGFRPLDPRISPLYGDLSGLPPTLVHVSSCEMLYDDCQRYVNKANASGTIAVLGVWPFMLHVWHIFVKTVPEAEEAFDHIEEFVNSHIEG